MIGLLAEAQEVLKKNGINLKTDISQLAHISNQIEKVFKIAPDNSLKGNIINAGLNVAEATTIPTPAGFRGFLKEMTKPDYNKKMRAFRSLTEQGMKK